MIRASFKRTRKSWFDLSRCIRLAYGDDYKTEGGGWKQIRRRLDCTLVSKSEHMQLGE